MARNPELPEAVQTWLNTHGTLAGALPSKHWLVVTTPTSWTGYLYLGDSHSVLANEHVSIAQAEGLTVYLSTLGLTKESEIQPQLLVFTYTGTGQWPEEMKLVVNGAGEDLASKGIYNGGTFYWADGT